MAKTKIYTRVRDPKGNLGSGIGSFKKLEPETKVRYPKAERIKFPPQLK